jgi:hypothetical protein
MFGISRARFLSGDVHGQVRRLPIAQSTRWRRRRSRSPHVSGTKGPLIARTQRATPAPVLQHALSNPVVMRNAPILGQTAPRQLCRTGQGNLGCSPVCMDTVSAKGYVSRRKVADPLGCPVRIRRLAGFTKRMV